MSSYCLKSKKKKKTENVNPSVLKTTNDKTMVYVLYVVAKNQDLLKSKKQKEY